MPPRLERRGPARTVNLGDDFAVGWSHGKGTTPIGHRRCRAEIYKTPRAWAERAYPIVYWQEHDCAGHFPAMEVPELFAQDLRAFARVAKGLP